MKEFRHTPYSSRRQKQRGIPDYMVEDALNNPDYIKSSFEGRKIAVKKVNGKTINIVFIEKERYIRIITLY